MRAVSESQKKTNKKEFNWKRCTQGKNNQREKTNSGQKEKFAVRGDRIRAKKNRIQAN